MKAAIFNKYGSPEKVLNIEEKEIPEQKENEVLVKVHCTAINDWDWSMIRGKPFLYRLMFGLNKPKHKIPGMELSGVVESLGKNVSKFNIGDEVYGDISDYGFGSFAEYVSVNENAIVVKPQKMSFEEATSVSHASMLAYQAIYDIGKIKNGDKVLINGAGGGFGTAAFQLLKMHNAEVTGVDTGEKLNMMKTLGFDHIIDYKKEDFTKNGQKYDLILDAKTNRSILQYAQSLKEVGHYVTVGGSIGKLLSMLITNLILSIFSKKKI